MGLQFSYFLPVNIVFGSGESENVGTHAAKWGKKALVVTGGSSAKKSGLLDRVLTRLGAAGLVTVVFDEARPNPLTTTAEKGARIAREQGCDVVVAVGGGSIIDCAKGIAFLAVNDGDISDYIYGKASSDAALPLIAIPTTCGTGSEGNGFAVLTNPENGDKKSLRCSAIVPKASIVDPRLMKTMPKKALASVGFDALCHCIEAYTANSAQPFTDAFSLMGIELVAKSLVELYQEEEGGDEAWEALTLASTIGGMVINTAGVTIGHGMEHPASGLKDIVHGQGLAALEPVAIEASWQGCPEKFARVSQILGGTDAQDCADAVRALLKKLDLDITLSDLGICEEDIPWMTQSCLKVAAGNITNNPVLLDEAAIAKLYRRAM